MSSLIALNQKPLPNLTNKEWFNLKTHRKNVKLPPNDNSSFILDSYRVGGTLPLLYEFARLNGLDYKSLKSGGNSLPLPDLTIHSKTEIKDVEMLTLKQINLLTEFSLTSYQAKARVKTIIDGDTIEIIIYLTVDFLTQCHYHHGHQICFAVSHPNSEGFFIQTRCRLFGMDAPEMNTDEGKRSKQKLEDKIKSLKGIVYVRCLSYDKYGRLLVEIYEDKEYNKSLNRWMIKSGLAKAYYGGEK